MSIYELALKEDLEPNGDLSTKYFEPKLLKAKIIAKEDGILACSEIVENVLNSYKKLYDSGLSFKIDFKLKDSQEFKAGDTLVEIESSSHALLICERTILNFLQRCCAVATKARHLSDLIKDYKTKVLDTRKTSPGMRELEKKAFKQGGGCNHRFNLSDMAMLKENHLSLLDQDLITSIKKLKKEKCPIEVEINKDNLNKLELVSNEGVEQIMLDNFSSKDLVEIIKKIRSINPNIKIEASGGITEKNIIDYAKTDIDYVSTAEASRARNIDLSFLIN